MSNQEVLALLRKIDNGYKPTEEEKNELSNIEKINWKDIESIPESINFLIILKELDLSGEFMHTSSLMTIPESIGNLPNLRYFILEYFTLAELPEELLSLELDYKNVEYDYWKRRSGIYTHGLRLQKQPVSLFYQPRELIQKYYDSEKNELKESKVIFMGDGGAGKSYTIQRIMNNGHLLENDTDVTHDISIEHWDNSDNLVEYDGTIDFWDFGGQDIYLSMHRCFLTERSCYVIVLCNRQYGSHRGLMRQARYWLKNISAFANDSPILIAVNTWSGQPRDGLSLTQLKNEFPNLNIVDQIVYDAHDTVCEEFNRITSKICKIARENYSYDLKFPVSWNKVRKHLLNEYSEENLISESEYYRICREVMTEHDGYYEEEIARWLLHWFNDLGYCFNYHDIDDQPDGKEYQVLKPQWVIRAMYRIINHKIHSSSGDDMPLAETLPQDLAKSKRVDGWIFQDEIFELLKEKSASGESYNEQEAEYIIRILRKFKLAYLVEDSDSEVLFIPALCSDLRPVKFSEVDSKYSLKTEYLIRFEFLPDTVMQHLMIKCYREGRRLKQIWKNGFHLQVTKGIIVVEMLDDTEIVIKFYESAGNSNSYGLHEMRDWLDGIYTDLGIKKTKDYVIKRTSRQKAYINVKALVNAYVKNPQMSLFYTQDDDIYEGHSVDELLKGLYNSNYREVIQEEVKKHKGKDVQADMEPVNLSKSITNSDIAGTIEDRFRTQFTEPPKDEKEVQIQLRKFLDAQGYRKGTDYERESGRVMFAGREYIPDFVLKHSNSVIEVKILKDKFHKSKMIEEMNADYSAYTKEYDSIIYLVYDLGIISDVQEFKRDFEAKGNVKVIIIKH